jgi:type IV pilus assembly protein PilQ
MPVFQFGKKNYRITLVLAVLTLLFLAGCVTGKTGNKTEKIATPETSQAQTAKTADASSSPEGVTLGQRYIHEIDVKKQDKIIEVQIKGNQKLSFTSIKQSFPFAICVYLPETGITPGLIPGAIEDEAIGGLKLSYADQDQTTAKLEILLNQDISYVVREEGEQLRVILSLEQPREKEADSIPSKEMTMASEGTIAAPELKIATPKKSTPLVVPDTPAVMTGIEFDTQPSGRSDIRVETDHPIKYDTTLHSAEKLYLTLYNTKISDRHKRPLLTRYFNSAVESIEPKTVNTKNAVVEINIREQVPFKIVQDQNFITMVFEPSQIEPPPFDKAKIEVSSATRETKTTALKLPAGNDIKEKSLAKQKAESRIPGESFPRYTGEKIKLDFYDTDIKNVFRILRSVSGLNFAIDKDVQGKVTMTLENPVPWDQVLDLVLKMNGLGKKNEGNVIRIATVATLQNEEKILQDAIAAKKKSLEQKKSFEPMVTQYIPINYSDAQADIRPHIEQMLSKDRGTMSVDQRTNMIILTDTQAKIDQALEIIYRLDTVTPQIMIEAKVVEVTKEFARSIGVSWNLSNAEAVTSTFVDDFAVSVNDPAGSGLLGDFSFFRLFGSSVTALNAQLEASEEQGDVRIVSSPRILTLDNKKAKIKQGQEIAYLERDDSGGSSVKFKDVDLLLEVTPHVTPDKRISMTLYITKNDVAGTTSTGVPFLATNEAETELLVNNNDTVVIGGVVKTTKNDNTTGLPFLAGLPILGPLFGVAEKTDNRNELLIFLTPSIVQLEQKRQTTTPAAQ